MRLSVTVVCAAALLAAAPARAGGVKTQLQYEYYGVEGRSALEVINSMLSSGPDYEGAHAYATTKVDVDPKLSHATEGGCRAQDLTLEARFTITLPRHRSPVMMSRATRGQYGRLVDVLMEHELKHEKIFRGCLNAIHRQIMALPPARSCIAFTRQVKEISDREWERCRVLNQALDDQDGARHDTLPLIADALREVARAQANVAFPRGQSPAEERRSAPEAPSDDPSALIINPATR